jgi:aspartyl-tRNA(Asn)/glutamyl-tRNA(Gln) amidotransferase subunit A
LLSEDILFSTVRELGETIRTRKLSPVALCEGYLARLETLGPKLGAVITLTRDLAMEQARTAEREIAAGHYRGALHGIPYGVKDAFSAKGIPTTWGTAPYRNQVFDYDATIVTLLRNAGAVLLGKLAMIELVGGFGYDNADASFTGPCRTPWNPEYWSGGSSAGPGAATSAGLVAFSVGGETGGSILLPSSYCGLAGMRTTYGRVSRAGGVTLSWSLDKVGPMCRSADDCGIVLAAIAGYDKLDPATSRRKFLYATRPTGSRRYKLGIVKGSYENVDSDVKANFEQSMSVLEKFADITHDLELPDFPYGPMLGTIMSAEGTAAFRDLVDTGRMREMANEVDRVTGYTGMMVSAVDYLQAMRARKPARIALDQLLTKVDALVAPTTPTVAPRVDEQFHGYGRRYAGAGKTVSLVSAGNLAGVPAITVPNGFGQDNLPTALQFMGPAWSEKTLIEIAGAYQERTDWHKRRPPIGQWMKSSGV